MNYGAVNNISFKKSHKMRLKGISSKNVHCLSIIFDSSDSSDKAKIRAALDEWEKYTCLTFAPRKSEKNYIYVQDDNSG